MKRIKLTLAVMPLLFLMANAQDSKSSDYYWYNGTQIFLEKGNQEYIIFDDALLSKSDKEQLVVSGNVKYTGKDNLKWGITKPNVVIEDSVHVLYKTPSYKSMDVDDSYIYVTHRFYVKLKDGSDFSILQGMAEKYDVIFEEDEDLPLWYVLYCSVPSSFNALELANIFYESGLFSVAEPEFMGGFIPDTAIEQLHNNKSENAKKIIYNGLIIIEVGSKKYSVQGGLLDIR